MTIPLQLNCTSLRHATSFKCIGPACEESCCKDWQIILDQASYVKTKALLVKTPADQLKFDQQIKIREENCTPAAYAEIILDKNGHCPFLDPTNSLCIIHRDFGESCLSQTCRTYPRQFMMIDNHYELSLSLSCPEAARLFLFDQQFDLVQIDHRPLITFKYYCNKYLVDINNPLTQYIDLVRGAVLQLLSIKNYPLNSRLFFSSFFANRTVPFFSRQKEQFSELLLAEEIKRLTFPQVLDNLHAQFESITGGNELPIDLPMHFIIAILRERTGRSGIFTNLLLKIWKVYGLADISPKKDWTEEQEEFNKIVAAYKVRRSKTPLAAIKRFDYYLDRYSQNFWFSHIYTESPNLLMHTRQLFIRIAMLRFLFYSHPEMEGLHQKDVTAALSGKDVETIDAITLEIFYHLARGIEHAPELLTGIELIFDSNDMSNIEHVCQLLLI